MESNYKSHEFISYFDGSNKSNIFVGHVFLRLLDGQDPIRILADCVKEQIAMQEQKSSSYLNRTSYTQFCEAEEFNWESFLFQELYIKEGLELASELADSWRTCPIGNLPINIPRDKTGVPLDPKLKDLGCAFGASINESLDDYERGMHRARKTFLDIQKRAIELLYIEGNNKQRT